MFIASYFFSDAKTKSTLLTQNFMWNYFWGEKEEKIITMKIQTKQLNLFHAARETIWNTANIWYGFNSLTFLIQSFVVLKIIKIIGLHNTVWTNVFKTNNIKIPENQCRVTVAKRNLRFVILILIHWDIHILFYCK